MVPERHAIFAERIGRRHCIQTGADSVAHPFTSTISADVLQDL